MAVKLQANRKAAAAIRAGRLVRQPCEKCGNKPAHAHHDDYSKPLEVRMIRRASHNPRTAREWQVLWDRFPTFFARENDLFRQRGAAQLERDQQDNDTYRREQRTARAKFRAAPLHQCPTCGSYTRAAA